MKHRFKPGEEVRSKYTIWLDDVEIPAEALLPILALTRDQAMVEFDGRQLWVNRANLKPDTTASLFPEIEPPRQLSLM